VGDILEFVHKLLGENKILEAKVEEKRNKNEKNLEVIEEVLSPVLSETISDILYSNQTNK
jgi:hypothetical protein